MPRQPESVLQQVPLTDNHRDQTPLRQKQPGTSTIENTAYANYSDHTMPEQRMQEVEAYNQEMQPSINQFQNNNAADSAPALD